MRTLTLALFLGGAMGPFSTGAARDTFLFDFNEGLGAGLAVRGYYLEDRGSYSNLSAMQLEAVDQRVVIEGHGNGGFTGWLGRSLTHDASGVRGMISVECDMELSEFVSGGGGFQLTLLIELAPRDRIMFSYVLPEPGRPTQSEVTLQEHGALRFTPRSFVVPNGKSFHMQLEFDTAAKAVRARVNGALWQEDVFAGEVTEEARIGIAATVRWEDRLVGRFDNLRISFDRAFRRAEVNADGAVDITDAVNILSYLFDAPGGLRCQSAADVDDNGVLEVTDAIRLLHWLFLDAASIPPPFSSCALDPSRDQLPCDAANCAG